MDVSTKELRIQPGRIIEHVARGQEVTITYRGKAMAKIVPLAPAQVTPEHTDSGVFGMWAADTKALPVEETVRNLRQGRVF